MYVHEQVLVVHGSQGVRAQDGPLVPMKQVVEVLVMIALQVGIEFGIRSIHIAVMVFVSGIYCAHVFRSIRLNAICAETLMRHRGTPIILLYTVIALDEARLALDEAERLPQLSILIVDVLPVIIVVHYGPDPLPMVLRCRHGQIIQVAVIY